jgi:hypothetical protein
MTHGFILLVNHSWSKEKKMPTNVFISFDHDDANQVNGFRSLIKNPNHPLDFHDHSLKEPVTGLSGRPIKYPPSDPRSKPVRDVIREKFGSTSKLVVLIGDNTWKSEWVTWEINTFFNLKSQLPGEPWKRIRGMKLKGCENAPMPDALMNGRSTRELHWDPEQLDKWLDINPNM